MKKLFFAIIIVGIAVWVWYYFFYKDEMGFNWEKIAKQCQLNDGAWLKEYKECEQVDKNWCLSAKGEYNECASACRHDPKESFCTTQCVPLCSFGDGN